MAKSLAHKWGQLLGDLSQLALYEPLAVIAKRHRVYLDRAGPRPARANQKRLRWKDCYGNFHDLDYVLERGGTDEKIGTPAAFIEVAWRKGTRHSKSKAQEIEGAVRPLADTYNDCRPFLGIVLAGEYTPQSLAQLRSRGFHLVHFPTESIVAAFSAVGIDASSNDKTPEREYARKIAAWNKLSTKQIQRIAHQVINIEQKQVSEFCQELSKSLSRRLLGVVVIVLHGKPWEAATVTDAVTYIANYQAERGTSESAIRFEIHVKYSNGDVIQASFNEKNDAIDFLHKFG